MTCQLQASYDPASGDFNYKNMQEALVIPSLRVECADVFLCCCVLFMCGFLYCELFSLSM